MTTSKIKGIGARIARDPLAGEEKVIGMIYEAAPFCGLQGFLTILIGYCNGESAVIALSAVNAPMDV
ncbi:hypothetical protein [Ketogulonicigenium vulgare]|uniref:hypothetical protein n=1 Tax=Ketogulonicigenium vulgare TaxID=92945 RepID=UPI00235A045A|nr:hypothetical protein [Ketogulonicigenium vulgare]